MLRTQAIQISRDRQIGWNAFKEMLSNKGIPKRALRKLERKKREEKIVYSVAVEGIMGNEVERKEVVRKPPETAEEAVKELKEICKDEEQTSVLEGILEELKRATDEKIAEVEEQARVEQRTRRITIFGTILTGITTFIIGLRGDNLASTFFFSASVYIMIQITARFIDKIIKDMEAARKKEQNPA